MRRVERHLIEGEGVLLTTRLHPRVVVAPATFLLLLGGLVGVFAGLSDGLRAPASYAMVAVALMALRLLVPILQWRRHVVVLTTARLIELSGLMRIKVTSIVLSGISDLRFTRSLTGKIFNYGELTVVAQGKFWRLWPLPRPRHVADAVNALRNKTTHAVEPGPATESTRRYTTPMVVGEGAVQEPERNAPSPNPTRPFGAEGRVLDGRYSLVSKLAAGGMGSVFEGFDRRLGRPVAVKLMREELNQDRRLVERFRREARSAAGLSHPHIASIFDYGEQDGTSYIVMELARGRSLEDILEHGSALAPHRAALIAGQTLEALQHAHDAGVVHRDIKPGNVIVDDRDRIKVTDFGIARAVGDSRITATGILLGSANYVAPEQVKGFPATPRSDVYSAGVLLYEMLTGAPPFGGGSPLEVAGRHVSDTLPLPSQVNLSVPDVFDDVVSRATAKEPDHRFRSAAGMAQALARCITHGTRTPTRAGR